MMQKVVESAYDAKVDVDDYRLRRDTLYDHMTKIGFKIKKPQGAFYLFVKSPTEDEMEFVETAKKYNILLVPGRGFGVPGYVRMCFCISLKNIRASLPKLTLLAKEYYK
jgi:aspartate aminotransferase